MRRPQCRVREPRGCDQYRERGDNKRTQAITGNSVDWLSMIFQLAHVPPAGESFELQVFTQRRFYTFDPKASGYTHTQVKLSIQSLQTFGLDACVLTTPYGGP